MSLIICPHCGMRVSSSTETCIHCGGTLKIALEKEHEFALLPLETQKKFKSGI